MATYDEGDLAITRLLQEVRDLRKVVEQLSTFESIDEVEEPDLSGYVDRTTDQTVAGVKTFDSIPVLPNSDPALDNQAARKKYVDSIDSRALRAIAKRTASQPLSNNSITAVEFTEADQEGATFWSVADNTKIIIPQDGWWLIFAGILISANANGARAVSVSVNNSRDIIRTRTGATPSGKWGANPSTYTYLEKDDYLELNCFQNSGSALAIDVDDFSPSIIVTKLL